MNNFNNLLNIDFRKAEETDFEQIWQIIGQAKAQMHRLNSCQWDEHYPATDNIHQDIESGDGYVFCSNNRILAYGIISFDGEVAYQDIQGAWRNSLPYVIVHRLAIADEMKQQGMAKRFMLQAEEVSRQKGIYNFRVDTNFDNTYMLRLINSLGFSYSGEVCYRGGKIRKAYEKSIRPHSYPLPIQGFSIREAIYEDAAAIYLAIDLERNDLSIWLPFVDNLKSVADEQAFLQSAQSAPYPQRDVVFIIEKGTEICGLAGFHFSDLNNHRTEIGYWLLPQYRGQGIVTEAVRYLCQWAFAERNINRIQIRCATSNQASNAIPLRLGFTFEGTEREGELLSSGEYVDIRVYSILKKDI